jgi:hypothetical protein
VNGLRDCPLGRAARFESTAIQRRLDAAYRRIDEIRDLSSE